MKDIFVSGETKVKYPYGHIIAEILPMAQQSKKGYRLISDSLMSPTQAAETMQLAVAASYDTARGGVPPLASVAFAKKSPTMTITSCKTKQGMIRSQSTWMQIIYLDAKK